MTPDIVSIGDISYATRKAWAQLSYEREWDDLDEGGKTWLTLEHACKLFFLLRAHPDSPEVFPKGKWASLQVLETIIDQALGRDK